MNKLYSILASIIIASSITSCTGDIPNTTTSQNSNVPYITTAKSSGNEAIYLSFNETMDNVTLDTVSVSNKNTGAKIELQNIETEDNKNFILILKHPLSNDTKYTIEVNNVTDSDGQAPQEPEVELTTDNNLNDISLVGNIPGYTIGQSTLFPVSQSIAISNNITYMIAYKENSDQIQVAMYDKDNNKIQTQIGGALVGNANNHAASITLSPEGTPYIAYINASNQVVISKYESDAWQPVGTPLDYYQEGDFYNGLNMVVSTSGQVYIGIRTSETEADIMKFDQSSGTWVATGAPNSFKIFKKFGFVYQLAMAKDGTLYIAYSDANSSQVDPNVTNGQLVVKKYDTSTSNPTWKNIGSNPALSSAFIYITQGQFSLYIDDVTNTPYVAYKTIVEDNNASPRIDILVKKYNSENSKWEYTDGLKDLPETASNINLNITPDNNIHLTYTDEYDTDNYLTLVVINPQLLSQDPGKLVVNSTSIPTTTSAKAVVTPSGETLVFLSTQDVGVGLVKAKLGISAQNSQ